MVDRGTVIDHELLNDASSLGNDELLSDGNTSFQTGNIVSTTSSTKVVEISGYSIANKLESGDKLVIAGSAAAGTYTVDQIISDEEFSVVESIVDSSSGTYSLYYKPGEKLVGVDTSRFNEFLVPSNNTLHSVISELNRVIAYRVVEFIAGENISERDCVRLNTSDTKVYKALADSLSHLPSIGFALETKTTGQIIKIVTGGVITGFTGLTANTMYYVSPTISGAIVGTEPNNYGQPIGYTKSDTTKIYIYAGSSESILDVVLNLGWWTFSFGKSGTLVPGAYLAFEDEYTNLRPVAAVRPGEVKRVWVGVRATSTGESIFHVEKYHASAWSTLVTITLPANTLNAFAEYSEIYFGKWISRYFG